MSFGDGIMKGREHYKNEAWLLGNWVGIFGHVLGTCSTVLFWSFVYTASLSCAVFVFICNHVTSLYDLALSSLSFNVVNVRSVTNSFSRDNDESAVYINR